MPQQESPRNDDLSWADPQLKERLIRDTAGVLKERGVNLPTGVPAKIIHDLIRITSLIWFEGQIVPREKFTIDPYDGGLLFGRGVWESTRTIDGAPWLWQQHIERMLNTAKLLKIELTPDRLPSAQQVTEFVRTLTAMEVIIRLNATAGIPGKPGIIWMTAGLPPTPIASIRLKTCRNPVEKGHIYQTWKTFQYATRLMVGEQAQGSGFDSTLLLDDEDFVLEAAHANIFFRLPNGWATPIADGGLLPGTVRQYVLDHAPLPMREQKISKSLLSDVSEAFVTNSNVGIVPVTQIDERVLPIGGETQSLMRWLISRESSLQDERV